MKLISDEELEWLAAAEGPESLAAAALVELKKQRAQGQEAVAFRFANSYGVGPMPAPEDDIFFHWLELELAKAKKDHARN